MSKVNKKVAMSELSSLMNEIIQNDGEVTFRITGNSMAPMLHHQKDRVCIVKPGNSLLKKYDIPLFVRKDGKYILHRIVAVKPDDYVIIGDNQRVREYPVCPCQVIGVVRGFWRGERYISCNSFWYKIYCRIWVFIYPIRWFYLSLKNLSAKILKHIRHNLKYQA